MEKDSLSFKQFSKDQITGWLRKDILDLLPSEFFADPVSFAQEMGGKVVKESRLRWAAIFLLPNQQKIFLKRDKTKDWLESLKYLILPSKARKEWFVAYQLKKRGLNIPFPLGWMETSHWGFVKNSYYISEAIGCGVSLIEDSAKLRDRFLLTELAKALRKIHKAGLFHKDLHAGNFLWDGQSLFLTDLHSTKIIRNLSLKQRLWNLSLLFHSLRSTWGEKDRSIFMKVYFEGEPFHLQKKEEFVHRIHAWMDGLQKRQWRSRTKRCLKESSEFSIKKEKGILYYHRRNFDLGRIKRVIEGHLACVKEKPSALAKHSPEVNVSILQDGGNRVCVKQFCYPTFWSGFKENFRRSKGLKGWVACHGLRARGIPSLKSLALMENKAWLGMKESFFLMEAFEASEELDRHISKGFSDFKEKRYFINTFARWLSNLHKVGLYHRDMKTCNILVSKSRGTWDFYSLDLEDVRLDERVDEKKLFKTLLQLNTSTPKIINKADRFRFFKEYLRLNPIIKNQRAFLQQLVDESKKRGLVYVSPQGVIIEPM